MIARKTPQGFVMIKHPAPQDFLDRMDMLDEFFPVTDDVESQPFETFLLNSRNLRIKWNCIRENLKCHAREAEKEAEKEGLLI